MQVLLVDDSPELRDLVTRALTREGHQVRAVATLDEARAALRERAPEVLVLDVALPDGTGLTLCRELRAANVGLPILLLTAHGDVPERVAGLDAGADDFLPKPFAVAELRARVRALGRRGALERLSIVKLLGAELDLSARRAFAEGGEVPLTAREWAIMELLSARRGRVVSRGEILEAVWGEATDAAAQSLDVMIARIRRKLGASAVRTLRGEGYALGEH